MRENLKHKKHDLDRKRRQKEQERRARALARKPRSWFWAWLLGAVLLGCIVMVVLALTW